MRCSCVAHAGIGHPPDSRCAPEISGIEFMYKVNEKVIHFARKYD